MSALGTAFIVRHEGFVSRAYPDPVGILTIGTGFTMRSKTARDYWLKTRGRTLRRGDTITREENAKLLTAALENEYGVGVPKALGHPNAVHPIDAGRSVSFNCGPGSLKWSWAKLYREGRHKAAGARLRKTAVTARGRRLAGLVRRRGEEADLLVRGDYGHVGSAVRFGNAGDASVLTYSATLKQDQGLLKAAGHTFGAVDGKWGPRTEAAVRKFQAKNGLVVDGILGPATRAKLVRIANGKREAVGLTGTAGATSATGVAAQPTVPDAAAPAETGLLASAPDWLLYGGLGILVIGGVYLAWFYRDEIRTFGRKL